MATHYRACNLCEAMCGIALEVEGGAVVSVRGDREDPFSQGHVCPKAVALKDVHEDPDRLRVPMRREGAAWREVSWEEAFSEAVDRLASVQDAHGRNAVAVYQGNPTVHNYGAVLFAQLFVKALRSRSLYSATSSDQLPHMLASLLMFGHQLLLPIPDVDRTDHLLMLGANPLASNGSLMTAPGMDRRLKALRARGGRLVVVDPRRTETAAVADRHLPIRPGTDALLLMALVAALFEEGLVAPGRLAAFTDGIDEVRRLAADHPPESAAAATGITAAEIRTLARELAAAPRAVVYGRMGISTQEFGALSCWLVNVLNVLTGNLDRPGGALFTTPAADLVALADRIGQRGHFAKGTTRVRALPEFGGEYPVAALAEEIETPGPGQVRALLTSAGNPVLSAPNGARLERALPGLEFMVSIDYYLNETTRHAHLVLPPTAALERSEYDLVFHALAVRNTVRFARPVCEPAPGARHDWQIHLELATRLLARRGRPWRARVMRSALSRLGPEGIVAGLLRFGPYGKGLRPFGGGLTLAAVEAAPHGIDLGPLEPRLPERLYTPGRRIALAPPRLVADAARLVELRARASAPGSLSLIGRRDLRTNNSWLHNADRLVKGPERCTLLMHPEDASARGLAHGQPVQVTSRVGAVSVPLEVTDAMMPGVVSLPHGWGHHREGTRLRVASARPGRSINDITDEQAVDPMCGNAAFSGVAVEVSGA